jgi:DNA-binding response OmpR family regulator
MNHLKKILVVEDEEKILNVVKSFLESKGFTVIPAEDGKKALELFDRENISMVLLDLMLPELSGEEVCIALRKKSRVPIIMLTAKSDEADMLTGLGIGADDYITKPFSLKALYARMEAVMRRSVDDNLPLLTRRSYQREDLIVDFESHIILKQSEEVKLTPNEFKILATLAKYPNKVFTRDELITAALGAEFEGFDRTIDSHIKNLRQKIETDPRNPVYVKTIHGVGYKFGGEV